MQPDGIQSPRRQKSYSILVAVVLALTAGLVAYALTKAFAWDEGFHLITAQQISIGRRPYLDFNFSQTPLNAYWNAVWIRVFGPSWRAIHVIAALLSGGAVWLIADFLFVRFPVPRWRFAASLVGACAVGLNIVVVQFGTIGQAYGMCLFITALAFRFAVSAVDRKGLAQAALAGFFACAGAASSLLTAPVCPVLGIWMVVQNRVGNRWAKLAAFLAGSVVPFLPVLWLFLQGPRNVFFNIIQYNLVFRQVEWPHAIPHDIGIMLSWIDSGDALILALLAAAGFLFVKFRSTWTRPQRSEFFLCAWLAGALCVHISSAHPTFPRYYLLSVPFASILAVAGLYFLAERLYTADRPFWPAAVLIALFAVACIRGLYEDRDDFAWRDIEKLAAKVNEVTPPNGVVLSAEQVYFVTGRNPPPGMELQDSHKLTFPPALSAQLHLVPTATVVQEIKAGRFSTVQTCGDEDRWKGADLAHLYAHRQEFDDCDVFWDFVKKP